MKQDHILKAVALSPDARMVRYFPPASGIYEVKPGLYPFGTPFGNGEADGQVFQVDDAFEQYREAKVCARSERLSKYYQVREYAPAVAKAITGFILRRLPQEHPDHFGLAEKPDGSAVLTCRLTEEILTFDDDLRLAGVASLRDPTSPSYASALDALAAQVQEDLAVVSTSGDGEDWASALHVCFPSRWAAEDKVGKNFADIHAPVAGIERINRAARQIVRATVDKGPYVRFAWTIESDTRLNHHVAPPPGIAEEVWRGRAFRGDAVRMYLRVERQTLWGFPNVDAFLFAIRTCFTDGEEIRKNPDACGQLRSAIASMTPESLAYKGLARHRDDVLAWLRASAG